MDNKKVKVKKTAGRGKGLFASESIRKDEIIAIFDGEVYDYDSDWTDDLADHCIQFAKGKFRNSNGIANIANHSCNPNCGIKNLFQIVAMRDIEPGEELTWDYDMSENNPLWSMDCQCGEKNCRNIIGRHNKLPKATKEKYARYISEWLVKKS